MRIKMKTAELIKGFSDATRLRLLHLLAHRGPELCVCDLVDTLELPQGTVSRHLMQLRLLGLVRDRRAGVWMHYRLAEGRGAMHAALLDGLKSCTADDAQLGRDLARFDLLHGQSRLACCATPETSAPPLPEATSSRESDPA